ncbi:MAG: NfeD family protein [Alphaproteobacteria bacterium]|nr:NfeD family protein [Alphaproteobacteria bacterium]
MTVQVLLYLETLAYWDWFIAALALIILEIVAPGAVFMWLGIAAGVVGAAVFIAPELDWKWQFAMFAVLSVVSIVVSRRYLKRRPLATDHPDLNRRGAQYVGRDFILDSAVVGGRGRMRVDDSTWRVEGPDLPAGTTVRVTEVAGATLKIEPQPEK